MRHPLVYVLHSSNLYGTERMALATLESMRDEFQPILIAPPGPAIDLAESLGIEVHPFRKTRGLMKVLAPILKEHTSLTFVATGVTQSAACILLNAWYHREINHIQIVHGGAGERGSYGNKKWLNHCGVTFVTVSEFARQRMIANGVRADRIRVVPNFLPNERVIGAKRRGSFEHDGVRKAIVVSRLDPLKRVSLLLDALDLSPGLRAIEFKIHGLGPDYAPLKERAAKNHPNVEFAGFCGDVASALPDADLLVHTCPVESFGLVILEAMAAGVPVLVPDQGGTGQIVQDEFNGFKFAAEDARDLARRLGQLQTAPAALLNRTMAGGFRCVNSIYTAAAAGKEYRKVFRPRNADNNETMAASLLA